MNPLRHTFIASCLATHPPPASKLRYLDVGCGGGIFAESAARLPATAAVTGIDPSADVLRVAEAHARQDPLLHATGRLRYLHTAVEALPVPAAAEDRFDVLSLFEVVEHITRPAPFLRSCLPFVRPGGWLVLSTMARTWTSWLTTKVVAEDLVGIVPRGTHDWEKYINPEEMRAFFMAQKGWGGDGGVRVMGCVYMPGFGWRMVEGSEAWGNYFFAVRKDVDTSASTAS
jgi:ubiquinone biosynthesis O-methyltransferase